MTHDQIVSEQQRQPQLCWTKAEQLWICFFFQKMTSRYDCHSVQRFSCCLEMHAMQVCGTRKQLLCHPTRANGDEFYISTQCIACQAFCTKRHVLCGGQACLSSSRHSNCLSGMSPDCSQCGADVMQGCEVVCKRRFCHVKCCMSCRGGACASSSRHGHCLPSMSPNRSQGG